MATYIIDPNTESHFFLSKTGETPVSVPKVYEAIIATGNTVAVRVATNHSQKLIPATRFDQFTIDGVTPVSAAECANLINDQVFSKPGGTGPTTQNVEDGEETGDTLVWDDGLQKWVVNPAMDFSSAVNYIPTAVFTAGVSLRKVNLAYVGSCIRVRRSSDDTLLDIGFDSAGNLDLSALLAHVGEKDGFVETWYDQYGIFNVSQATNANQPKIVEAGQVFKNSGRPYINFTGTEWLTGTNPVPGAGTGLTAFAVLDIGTTAENNEKAFVFGGNGFSSGLFIQRLGVLQQARASVGANIPLNTLGAAEEMSQYSLTRIANTGTFYRNGVEQSTANGAGTNLAVGSFTVGAGDGAVDPLTGGKVQEILISAVDLSTERPDIDLNQVTYWLDQVDQNLNLRTNVDVKGYTTLNRAVVKPYLMSYDSPAGTAIPEYISQDPATELVVPFTDASEASDPFFKAVAGELLILQPVNGFTVLADLCTNRTAGPDSELKIWTEYTIDGGLSWMIIDGSGSSKSLSVDGESNMQYSLPVNFAVLPGVRFRIKITKIGGATVNLQDPSDLIVNLGTVNGKAAAAGIY